MKSLMMCLKTKNISNIKFLAIGLLLCLISCKGDKVAPVDMEVIPIPGTVVVMPGYNRFKVEVTSNDQLTTKVGIRWTGKDKEVEVELKPDVNNVRSGEYVVEDFPEGEAEVIVFFYNTGGRTSGLRQSFSVYGERYAATLVARKWKDMYFLQGSEGIVTWEAAQSDEIGMKISYIDEQENEVYIETGIVPQTSFLSHKSGTEIICKSLFVPAENALDTLEIEALRIAPQHTKSRIGWNVLHNSSLVAEWLEEKTEQLTEGVQYTQAKFRMQFKDNPLRLISADILEIDLAIEGLEMHATTPNNGTVFGLQTVLDMCVAEDTPSNRVIAGVNADYFFTLGGIQGTPRGPLVRRGVVLKTAIHPQEGPAHTYFTVNTTGIASIGYANAFSTLDLATVRETVGGRERLIENNNIIDYAWDTQRAARTAVAVSAGGKKIYLVVVDGGRASIHSAGMLLDELSLLMNSFNVTDAMNLDGGGSAMMVARDDETSESFRLLSWPYENPIRAVGNALTVIKTN